jgi:O-acetyl-ADP-ribose deacetylase (regulator of RNase III)
MSKINYVIGDATAPQGEGKKIICHICNDMGAWGAGFVLALSAKWKYPENRYRAIPHYELGSAMVLKVEEDLYVANMIAQHGLRPNAEGVPPVRYLALTDALSKVNDVAMSIGATLHMPRIGCGLAGGEWSAVEAILNEVVTVDVTVYDLP